MQDHHSLFPLPQAMLKAWLPAVILPALLVLSGCYTYDDDPGYYPPGYYPDTDVTEIEPVDRPDPVPGGLRPPELTPSDIPPMGRPDVTPVERPSTLERPDLLPAGSGLGGRYHKDRP